MANPKPSTKNVLHAGRKALARSAWEEARARFEAALSAGETPEAWEGVSWAATWLDDAATTLQAREQAYRLYRKRNDRAGAARMAIWLANDHFDFLGEPAVADGWFQRARRLLEGLEPAPEHAWLTLMDGYTTLLFQHDTAEARRLTEEALALSRALGQTDIEIAGLAQAEHAAFLTRAAAADNLAVFTQYIAVLGGVEDDIVECFKKGGGVPYEKYPRFHAVMMEDSGQSVLSSLESHVLPLVPGLTDRLAEGIRVLDVGCGSGRILNRLAELYPKSRFTGIDLSPEAIGHARGEAAQRGLRNVDFLIRDLSDFHEAAAPEAFDLISTFDAVHDQAKPLNVLKDIRRALKADGVYLMQDIRGASDVYHNIGHPIGPFLYTISTLHCMTVSLAQGGEGLGAMWGEEKTRAYLQKAGFRSIETHQLAHDIQNNWYVVRK